MSILDEIVANKRREVDTTREEIPVKKLEKSVYFSGPCISLCKYIKRPDLVGVIAEIKRRSPSKGVINPYISVKELSVSYMQAGASALSILTESKYFGGANEDLSVARKNNLCPILRKDFVIDEYQIIEAKSIGADAVLIIAAITSPDQIRLLSHLAKSLGLEVVLEVHSNEELRGAPLDNVDIIGVNNRDLKTFDVQVSVSEEMFKHLPSGKIYISESGITDPAIARKLKNVGYHGFLIGELFMKGTKPGEECAKFVDGLKGDGK